MKLSSNRLSASLLVHDATRATGGLKKQCKNGIKLSLGKHNISQSNSENLPDDRDKWRSRVDILTVNALKGRMLVTPADTKVDLGLLINLTSSPTCSQPRLCVSFSKAAKGPYPIRASSSGNV